MADVEAADRISVARLMVAKHRPYYAAVLWALQPIEVKGFSKMAPGPIGVDQHLRLYYDPEEVVKWDNDTICGVMVHEIGHVLRSHATRRGDRDHLGWNIAGDCEINDDLKAEGLTLPKGSVYPSMLKCPDGLMAEEYYDKIPVVKISVTGAGNGACGSVADGQPKDYEEPADGSDKAPQGIGQAAQELLRQKVAQDVEAHAKSKGNVPGWLERWASERLRPKVNWRKMLAAYVRRALAMTKGNVDYTYQRVGRRQSALPDFVIPGMQQPKPQIAVVVDTSGSMSERELAQALAEIEGVLSTTGGGSGVTVLSCDYAVHTTQKVFKAQDVKLMGGGGTSMTVGLRAAEALRPRPHVIILVTDCETDWPPAMKTPLIVARTSKGSPAPSWAKCVDVVP